MKKLLKLLLSTMAVITLLVPISAEDGLVKVIENDGETNYFDSIQEAIDNTESNEFTVELGGQLNSSSAIEIPEEKSVTLNLNGNKLLLSSSYGKKIVYDEIQGSPSFECHIYNKGNLMITNGSINLSTVAVNAVVNEGEFTLGGDAEINNYGNSVAATIVNVGGSVETSGKVYSKYVDCIETYGGRVSITGGRLESDQTHAEGKSVLVIFNRNYNNNSPGAEVVIDDGILISDGYVASTNNLYSGGDSGSSLSINGGTLSSRRTSIYWPSSGVLSIGKLNDNGPTITSTNGSGVEVCSGTLNVYSGTISGGTELSGADIYETDDTLLSMYRSNSGSSNIGDSITIIGRRGAGYATSNLEVNISGGLFTSSNYGVRNLDCNLKSTEQIDQDVSVKITDGSFDGGIKAIDSDFVEEDDKKIVSGGTFTSDPSAYVDQASQPQATIGSTYAVGKASIESTSAANLGDTVTLTNVPAGTSLQLPEGTTVVNKTNTPATVNGIVVQANGTITTPVTQEKPSRPTYRPSSPSKDLPSNTKECQKEFGDEYIWSDEYDACVIKFMIVDTSTK